MIELTPYELRMLELLRARNPAEHIPTRDTLDSGDRLSDRITKLVGSWRFIVIQTVLLIIWVALNITAYVQQWDPYPFILLNLMLSFQAAYTAPIILMSQNREADLDRQMLHYYYEVNVKGELEIELLHQKVDRLLEALGEKT